MGSETNIQSEDDILASILEEFMESVRRGEAPDATHFVSTYPQLETKIREVLSLVSMVERSNADEDTDESPEQIGEYRIVGELGRGGMGVVYRAVQQSLNREVALKVLPPQAIGNEESRRRFRREATAAASLHHTNIVPVFEVGESDGIFFYAMQFIDGECLNDVRNRIREHGTPERSEGSAISDQQARLGAKLLSGDRSDAATASPYFESVARVGIQAADALHHAHSRGVIHRDVKPSNLILDQSGVVWLTDFGLAKLETDDLTRTGQLLGTTRYMSPERFKGECTPLNDVYGLGATLYELLTLRPAFEARDHLQLIEQIASREPTPPREIDRRIPRDLETIVLKAMEKEPRRRYGSALEMLEDLRLFCAGEPIRARSVRSFERMIKWARRRPAVTLLGSLLLLVGTAGFAVSGWQWAEAIRERDAKAVAQKEAEENLQYAQEAIQRMLSQVGDKRLADIPRMNKLRRDLLLDAVELNQRFLTESDDPAVLADIGATHARLARIFKMLGDYDSAVGAFHRAREIAQNLQQRFPSEVTHKLVLAETAKEIAQIYNQLGKTDNRDREFAVAIQLTQECSEAHPFDKTVAITRFSCLAAKSNCLEKDGRFVESIAVGDEAFTVIEGLPPSDRQAFELQIMLLKARMSQSIALTKLDRLREADEFASQVITSAERLVEGDSRADEQAVFATPGTTRRLAAKDQVNRVSRNGSLNNGYGSVFVKTSRRTDNRELLEVRAAAHRLRFASLRKLGHREEAREQIRLSIQFFDRLANEYPHIPDYERQVCNAYTGFAISYADTGNYDDAERWFQAAIAKATALSDAFPDSREFHYAATSVVRMTGIFYSNSRQLKLAEKTLAKSITMLEELSAVEANNSDLKMEIAKGLHTLSTTQRALSEIDAALQSCVRSIELIESAASQMNNIPHVRHKLSQARRQYGELLDQSGETVQAGQQLKQAVDIQRTVVADAPDNPEHHRHMAINLQKYADWMVAEQVYDQALLSYQESLRIRNQLVKEQPGWFPPKVERPDCLYGQAEALLALDRPLEANDCYQTAQKICETLLKDRPNDLNLREDYARGLEHQMRFYEANRDLSAALKIAQQSRIFRQATVEQNPDQTQAVDGLANLLKDVDRIENASSTNEIIIDE